MPDFIGRDEVRRLVREQDAVVAEVLPRAEYDWAHLSEAMHLPLKGWTVEQVESSLGRDRPVVVYCNDSQCDMSPRAAWRLGALGYDAYDYVAGKADWLAHGLPHEGHAQLAGDHLTSDVPTCSVDDRLDDVAGPLDASRFGMLVVLNAEGVVLGRLETSVVDDTSDRDVEVAQFMYEGPTTVRPSEELAPLTERMRRVDVDGVLVTRSDGRLLGILERDPAQRALEETGDADR